MTDDEQVEDGGGPQPGTEQARGTSAWPSAAQALAERWGLNEDEAVWTACELARRNVLIERSGATAIDLDMDDQMLVALATQASRLGITIDAVVYLACVEKMQANPNAL